MVEKIAIILLAIWAIVTVILSSREELAVNYIIAIAIVYVFLLGIILIVQKFVDSWLLLSSAQANFSTENVFNSLYNRSPVGYLTLNESGMITNANQAAIGLLKVGEGSVLQTNLFDLIMPDEDSDRDVMIEKIKAGLTISDEELPVRTIDGGMVWTMFSVVPYQKSGEKLVSIVDVTEKKNIDTAKSEFVALATHQLRTPIAAIRWNVELLARSLKEVETEAQSRYLEKVDRNVHRMINLINDFLSVSKLEMGTYAAETKEINLSDFFDSVVDEFSEKITEKGIALNRIDNPPQLTIKTDRRLFHIIISNLFSNATKYSKTDGELNCSYTLSGSKLTIKIADDGIGIPENELANLFTKFYRATNAQSHQTEGTGLGLYIVKESVEQLGGEISVSSDTDKGAEFTIELPVELVN